MNFYSKAFKVKFLKTLIVAQKYPCEYKNKVFKLNYVKFNYINKKLTMS